MRLVALAVLALLSASPALAAQEAATPEPADAKPDQARLAKARALVALIIPPEQREKMFATVLNSFIANYLAGIMQADPRLQEAFDTIPELKPVFARFVDRQRLLALQDLRDSTPELMEAYAAAYARNFTLDELDALQAFFVTPAGRKYVDRTSTLLTDPDIAAWQRRVTATGQARQQEELKRLEGELMPILRAHGMKPHAS